MKHADCHSIQKLGWFLAIFAVRPIHFIWGEFVFTPTASYIVHWLKVHCHSISLSELYNLNKRNIPLSLCLKIRAMHVHFAIGRICVLSNYSKYSSFITSTLPFCFHFFFLKKRRTGLIWHTHPPHFTLC